MSGRLDGARGAAGEAPFPISFRALTRVAELADWTAAFTIRAACRLDLADHLAARARPRQELAEATGTDAAALGRLLRALAVAGIVAEVAEDEFALTELGDLLRSDHPLSLRDAFRMFPDVAALAALDVTVRTGTPAVEHLYARSYWDYLAAHPRLRAEFDATQRALTRLEAITALRSYRWSELRTVVDVGGNDGTFLARLLAANPSLEGVVFDLPEAAAAAAKVLAESGVADRCRVVAGSIFETAPPARADAYVVKRVLVGMSDDEALAALRIVRKAMGRRSRLLVMEPMGHPQDIVTASMDVLMLVLGAGRVRTADDFERLLAEAGLEPTKAVTRGLLTLLEARRPSPTRARAAGRTAAPPTATAR